MRTLQDQLVEKGLSRSQGNPGEKKNSKPKPKSPENLSDREWRELMGIGRDTYKRVGGAIRRR